MVVRPNLFQVIVLVVGSAFSIPCIAQCTWYPDQDADGFGTSTGAMPAGCNAAPAGHTLNSLDCNDNFFNDAEWKSVGTAGVGSGNVVSTDLEIAPDGTPYILYRKFTDPNPTAVVAVKKFNGSSWVSVGADPIAFSDYIFGADMAIDGNGVPYIAFVDQDMGDKVTVIKYTTASNSWNVVGNRAMSADPVLGDGIASLAIDGNNIPHVLFANASGDAFVMRFDPAGNAWQEVGAGSFATVGSSEYSITIGSNNVPYVVFAESDGEISVMRFTGVGWEVVGSRSFSDNYVSSPHIQLDGNNVPYAAYFDEGSLEIIVQRYNAASSAWVKVGGPVFANDYAELSLAVDRTHVPYVAHNGNGKLTVEKWDGSDWVDVGNKEFADALNISLAIAPDNIPFVSCRDLIDSDFASVRKITPVIVPPGTPVLAATKTSTCSGETITLSITAGDRNDATQWKWYAGGCGSGISIGAGLELEDAPTITTTYYARAEGSCVTAGSCGSIIISVTAVPTAPTLSATSSDICPGSSTGLSITGGTLGNATTQQWAWYKGTCGDVSNRLGNGTTLTVSPGVNTTYYARGEGSCNGTCTPVAIQVVPYPVVTLSAAPVVCQGESARLRLTSGSNAASQQWQADDGLGSWTDIPAETGSALTRLGTDLALNANGFRVVVKNSIGCEAEFQSTITVLPQPAIAAAGQPVSATICAGANAAFEVTAATGTSLNYQWQVDDGSGSGFTDIANGGVYTNATTRRLQITGAVASLNGHRYRAQLTTVVSSSTICNAAVSDPATLTINTGPTIDAGGQPADASICPGGTADFSVTASGIALTYQWQERIGGGFANLTEGGSYMGVTSSALRITSVPNTWSGRRYRVVIQSASCASVTSNGVAAIRIIGGFSIGAGGQPASTTVCPGGTANFSVTVSAGGLTYQWQEDAGSGFNDLVANSTYSGVTSQTLTINNVPASLDERKYRVVIQSAGCASVSSDGLATIAVKDAPTIAGQPADVAVCAGELASFIVSASGPTVTYQWQEDDGSGFKDIRNGSVYQGVDQRILQIQNPPDNMNGYRLQAVLTWECGVILSASAQLSVNPLPVISAGPDKTISQRSSVVLEGAVSSNVAQFDWTELANTGQANNVQPEVSPMANAYYTLSATSDKGCSATDQVLINVLPLFNIPNAFSPNNDGINDTWVISGVEVYPNASVKVFNRYGVPVFTSGLNASSWDGSFQGKKLPWGTYYYVVDLQNGEKPASGWVLIFD